MAKKYKPISLRYPGGKSKAAKKIIANMPTHKTYVEPFAGAAHVFFKKETAKKNVLNDINKELIGFFKDARNKKICCDISSSRKKLLRLKKKKNKSVCEYIYLNKNNFGGKGTFDGSSYYGNTKHKIGKKFCIDGSKLKNAKLTSKDYKTTIKEHDSKDTLFYVDPPYVKANVKDCLYGKNKCQVTPEEVAKSLKNIKGKAIISYDNHPSVRKAFKGFKIGKIELPYSFKKVAGKTIAENKTELLIKNFTCKLTKDRKICKKV